MFIRPRDPTNRDEFSLSHLKLVFLAKKRIDLPEDIDIEDFEDDEPGELYQMLGMVILPLCSEMHGQ